jgi:predicted MPP superfamily phosphohydrolase
MTRLSRRTFLKTCFGSAAAMAGMGAYALGFEPAYRLRIQPYAPVLPRWPEDLPLSIAVIADLHIGEPYMPLRRVEEIVAAANAVKPDLVLLLGDYAAGHRFVTRPVPLRDFAAVMRQLQAPLGTYAILGNHDWWDDPAAQANRRGPIVVHRELERAGIPVLENGAVRLRKDGRAFWLLGLGDQHAFLGRPLTGVHDLTSTLAHLTDEAPAILLAH